ncbi:MAG TPA: fibronectin type III domain-containing protein [Spirochaetia bacterium]|nr:fibronectin type III domain-containing protein [Spirochaetia bacterium]
MKMRPATSIVALSLIVLLAAFGLGGCGLAQQLGLIAPNAPTGLAASWVTGSSTDIEVSWNSSVGATSYTLSRSSNGSSGPFKSVYTGASVNFTDTGLSAAVSYWYEVVATSGAGSSANSDIVEVSSQTSAGSPVIALAAASLVFTATAGGADPAAQTVSVTNTGAGTLSGLSATVSSSGNGWLTASLSATTAPATLTVTPSTGSLSAGTYTATVSVASSVSGVTSKSVGVTLTVSGPPAIGLSAATLTFTAMPGGADPSEQTVSVTNTGGGSLTGLSVIVSPSGNGWLTASLSSASAPATLTVTPSTGSLAAGTYTATVSIASSVPGVVTQSVGVTFTVSSDVGSDVITVQ